MPTTEKHCEICEAVIAPGSHKSKYCSPECAHEARKANLRRRWNSLDPYAKQRRAAIAKRYNKTPQAKEAQRRWREANPEKYREKRAAASREWKRKNPDKARAIKQRWNAKNPHRHEKYLAEKRELTRKTKPYLWPSCGHRAVSVCAECHQVLKAEVERLRGHSTPSHEPDHPAAMPKQRIDRLTSPVEF